MAKLPTKDWTNSIKLPTSLMPVNAGYRHMTQSLDKLTIKGFKSIEALENFDLTNLNVLIGGNGAGKSNFIDFFRMLRAMMGLPLPGLASANLQAYTAGGGGSSDFIFMAQR